MKNNQHNNPHGFSGTKTYTLWKRIKQKCFNPNNPQFKDYGGRGITLYTPWVGDFLSFHNYLLALLSYTTLSRKTKGWVSLDRKNNDGNYEPGNLRWSADNSLHRSNSRQRPLTGKGVCYIKNPNAVNKWFAYIDTRGNNRINVGTFKTKEEALLKREEYIRTN